MSRTREEQQGFTLIELLIVIVILGILAAVVVFAVGGITQRAASNSCKADFKTITSAQEAYRADHGAYASSMQELQLPSAAPTPPYIKTIPSQQAYRMDTDNSGTITVYTPGNATAAAGTTQASCP